MIRSNTHSRPLLIHVLACVAGLCIALPALAVELPDGRLDYGMQGFDIPPAERINATRPRTVQLLAEAMQGAAEWRRVQLVYEIGLCRLPQGAPGLRQAMRDESPAVRAQAARSAAVIDEPALRTDLEQLLQDPVAEVRRSAVAAYAALADQAAASPAVRAGLDDEDLHVRIAALRTAAHPDEAAWIAERLPNYTPVLQVEAIRALGRLQTVQFSQQVAGFADDAVALRAAAMTALGQMQAADQLNVVLSALEDPHPTVRRAAVAALAGVADEPVRQDRGIAMLADVDPTVRTAAAELLGDNPTVTAIEPLVEQLAYPYRPLHHAAREALIQGEEREDYRVATIEAGVRLIQTDQPRRQEDGSYILGARRSDAAADRHMTLLDVSQAGSASMDWAVVAQAAESLGLIGVTDAGEQVVTIARMSHQYQQYRSPPDPDMGSPLHAFGNAIVAAGRLGQTQILGDCARLLRNNPEFHPATLRDTSLWSIGILATPEDIERHEIRFFNIYLSDFESEQAKFEALKAMGNIGHTDNLERLHQITQTEMAETLRWIAHWSYQRITGEDLQYTPPVARWQATEASIVDLTPQ